MTDTPDQGDRSPVDRWRSAGEFKQCARMWADKIQVTPARIQLQAMTRKWASCSTGGVVSFNKQLLQEDRSFGEQVIVHELIHLKVPNHGPVFRALLSAHLGGALQKAPTGLASLEDIDG